MLGADSDAKAVVISYAPSDSATANRLREVLSDYIGSNLWVRDHNLQGGELIADALARAVAKAKWFILFVSEAALACPWVRTEADLATLRAIQEEDFQIVIFQLDGTPLPPRLQHVARGPMLIPIADTASVEDRFLELADTIEKTLSTRSCTIVYVDRGSDLDQFALVARRNSIVFIHGWRGIGKSAFVSQSVRNHLGKRPLRVALTRGHSADLFAREILRQSHVPQPINSDQVEDEVWIQRALDAVNRRAEYFFLFIDNAEDGFDPYGKPFPYLDGFLKGHVRSGQHTHVVLTTTRQPHYHSCPN